MENNKIENKEENIRSVSDRWMDKIFNNMSRAEELERIAKTGFIDIDNSMKNTLETDLLIKENVVSNAKLEALNLMLMEFDTIEVSGGNVLFREEFFRTFHSKMAEIRNLSSLGLCIIKRVKTNNNPNKQKCGNLIILTPHFYETLNKLCELRKLLVNELKDILFLTKPKKQTEGRL